MKRRDLERHLKKHGTRLLREGGRHSYWGMDAERSTSVPRRREISLWLAFGLAVVLTLMLISVPDIRHLPAAAPPAPAPPPSPTGRPTP